MIKKLLLTCTVLAACSSIDLRAAQTANIQEFQQLSDPGIQPNDLRAYLEKEAPGLVQFVGVTPTKAEAALYGTIVQSKKPVLLKFYLKGCGPCKTMQQIVEIVAKQFNDSILVINIELSESTNYLMHAFKAHGVPTLVFFKDGKKMEQFTGALTQAELTNKIKKLVN